MKINEIVQEGILDTLGRGIAQGLGARVDHANRDTALASKADIQSRSTLPAKALTQFKQVIANSGINLANPRTYDYDQLAEYLKDYSKYYFVGNLQDPMASYLVNQIDSLTVPKNLTDASIAQFFAIVNDARSQAVDQGNALTTVPVKPIQTKQTQQEPQPQTQQEPQPQQEPQQTDNTTTGLPANVSVLASSPMVLQVGKRRFELDDMDQWHPLGSKKTVSPGEAAILNRYLSML